MPPTTQEANQTDNSRQAEYIILLSKKKNPKHKKLLQIREEHKDDKDFQRRADIVDQIFYREKSKRKRIVPKPSSVWTGFRLILTAFSQAFS